MKMGLKELAYARRTKTVPRADQDDDYERENQVEIPSDDETHSEELDNGASQPEIAIQQANKNPDVPPIVQHDAEQEDEYAAMTDDYIAQDLETPMAKKMKAAFTKAKLVKLVGKSA